MLKVFHFAETKQGSPEALRARLADTIDLVYSKEIPSPADYEILIAAFPHQALLEASPKLKTLIIPFADEEQ